MSASTRTGLVAVLLVASFAGLTAQQPRDNVVVRNTSATISGLVVADDGTGRPIRHAIVTVSGGGLAASRAAVTDELGRFAIGALPAGSYTLAAARPGYVAMRYGQKRPGKGSGVSLSITAGQAVDAGALRLPRGAVISGTITDESGRPRRGIQVSMLQYGLVNGERQLMPVATGQGQVATDDRGLYRAYGLAPGEYVVSSAPPIFEGLDQNTELRRANPAVLDWADRQLQGGAVTSRPGIASDPRPASGTRVGLAPLYYPGTADASSALAIRVAAGEERTGVDFAVGFVPTARVDGVVTGPDGLPATANIAVLSASSATLRLAPNVRTDAQGKFTIPSLPPGQFTIMARPQTSTGPGAGLWASSEIIVSGQDYDGLALTLQPGSVVAGRVLFDGTTPPADFSQVRVTLTRARDAAVRNSPFSVSAGRVRPDGTFEITGIIPGSYRMTATGAAPGSATWALKSALVSGRDVADAVFDIRPGEAVTNAAVTFTDRIAEISGTLSDSGGRPAPDYYVVAFSTDRNDWFEGSRRVRPPVRPSSDGRFQLPALPPGSYYVAALTDLDAEDMADRTFLEQVAASALTITLAEGERKLQNFRLAGR